MSSRFVTLQPSVSPALFSRGVPGQGCVRYGYASSIQLDIMWLIGTTLSSIDNDGVRDVSPAPPVSRRSPI
jgi:hypothetical protein